MAARNGATGAVLRWLLEQGADWRLQATSGWNLGETALGIAKREGKAEAASVLAAWVSEHGSVEEAAEVKQRGEARAAHSTPNCRHVSPEPVLVKWWIYRAAQLQLVVHQAWFIFIHAACLLLYDYAKTALGPKTLCTED